jgi:PAS domain S-box-containing protein
MRRKDGRVCHHCFEAFSDMVFVVDENGTVIFANAAAAAAIGMTTKELMGKTQETLFGDNEGASHKKNIQRVFETGEPYLSEQIIPFSKDLVWTDVQLIPLIQNNSVYAVLGICRDISSRKRTERCLKLADFSLEKSNLPLFWLTPEGGVAKANDAACKSLGYSREELLALHIWDFDPMHSPESWKKRWAEIRKSGSSTTLSKHQTRNGLVFPIEAVSSYFRYNESNEGGKEFVVSYVSNITKRKRDEQDLLNAKHAAEVANRMKDEFLANISHEIRTPMTCVLGTLELMKDDQALSQEHKDNIDVIYHASTNLLAIVDDILDFAQIETGRVSLSQRSFDIVTLVHTTVQLYQPMARSRQIAIGVVMGGLPPTMLGDPVRIKQILSNLINNALKFTPKGGHVEVELSVTNLSDLSCNVCLAVKDTGIGIAKDKQNIIFDRFTQADATLTRRFGGTGLGLAISRRLAEMMHGSLRVESEEGKGSVFRLCLTLPITSTLLQEPGLERSFPGLRVLVAEDVADNQKVAQAFLERLGCTVTLVANGELALTALRTGKFDVLFLDCQMPIMDGFEVAEILRREGNETPVIAMTAHATARDRQRCLDAGMHDYISKPFRKQTMADVLSRFFPQGF